MSGEDPFSDLGAGVGGDGGDGGDGEAKIAALMTRTYDGNYMCVICAHKPKRRLDLMNHIRARHVCRDFFGCTMCEKKFPTEATRKTHYQAKHGLVLSWGEIRALKRVEDCV